MGVWWPHHIKQPPGALLEAKAKFNARIVQAGSIYTTLLLHATRLLRRVLATANSKQQLPTVDSCALPKDSVTVSLAL